MVVKLGSAWTRLEMLDSWHWHYKAAFRSFWKFLEDKSETVHAMRVGWNHRIGVHTADNVPRWNLFGFETATGVCLGKDLFFFVVNVREGNFIDVGSTGGRVDSRSDWLDCHVLPHVVSSSFFSFVLRVEEFSLNSLVEDKLNAT